MELCAALNPKTVSHLSDQPREHTISRLGLPLEIRQDLLVAFRRHDIYRDGMRLPESPAPPDTLVVGFERMRGEERDMRAMLEIESPRANLRLRD